MRLPLALSAILAAAMLATPAWAGPGTDYDDDDLPPPPSAMVAPDMPPPPPPGYYGQGPGWDHMPPPPPHGEWTWRCGGHHADVGPGCHGYPAPQGYGYGYMGYGVPMMMVPVLRDKPCPERVVEEWVEEPVRVRRRHVAPRRHVVPDKRVRIVPDKRLPMDKRIAY